MDMKQTTKMVMAWELYQQRMPKSKIATHIGVHRETVGLWIQGIEGNGLGLEGYIECYLKAKKGERAKRKIDPLLKRKIWTIREREMDCCGEKIQYFLKREHGIELAVSTIYEILSEKYQLRSKWKKNKVRGDLPKASKPREVVQMDSIDFGGIFAFTAIDTFSRESDVVLRASLTSHDGYEFLKVSLPRRFNGFVELIQTDGGSEFEWEFRDHVLEFTRVHRIARPYKKNEQSFIESFNRTVRKECLGWIDYHPDQIPELTHKVNDFLHRYHYHRPHMGLGMVPPLLFS